MKRILCLLLAVILAAGTFSGCHREEKPYIPTGDALDQGNSSPGQNDPEESKSFSLGYHPEKGFNPYSCKDSANRTFFPLLYQGLFTVDSDYQVYPVLCREYTRSLDMKTYVFYLEDATFPDGSSLTAEDVVASYTAADESGYYGGRFQHITSWFAREDGGVQIQLDTPCGNLPLLLDIPIVKAEEAAAEAPMGTGAYVLEDSSLGHRLRLRTDWWSDAALPVSTAYVPLVEVGGATDMRDQFEKGRIDLVCTDPCSDTYVDFRGDYELFDCENGIFLYMGCKDDSEVFGNLNVRSALTYAINREYLVDTYYRSFAMAANLPVSPLSPYYDEALAERYAYDPERFARVIAEEGMVGKEVTLVVAMEDPIRVRVTRKIAEMLEESGLIVQLRESGSQYFTPHLLIGEYDLYLASTKLSPNMDLSPFYSHSGSLNYGGMADVGIYAQTLEALADAGNYNAMYRKAMDEGMLIPILFQTNVIYASRGAVSDLTPARDNLFFCYPDKTAEDVFNKDADMIPPDETVEETTEATTEGTAETAAPA